jgi:predicted DNA binding CopG/RHH family protein
MTMRRFSIITLLLALVAMAHAQRSVAALKAEIAKTSGGHQAKLYAELAESVVGVANDQFNQGESVKGHETVQELLDYARKAHDGALSANSNRKEVEIHLRNAQRHLENVKRTLAAEDRPALDAVEKKLEQLRQDLLDAMWSPKKKDGK